MNELTVIIKFCNEGLEVDRTVKSIRETAGMAVNIVLVDDFSEDGIDYEKTARQQKCVYVRQPKRMGVANSLYLGMLQVQTPYALLIDGHMWFYHDDWWKKIVAYLKNNERAIYCTKGVIYSDGERKDNYSYGAHFHLLGKEYGEILEPKWNKADDLPDQMLCEIPCVLGATYGISKRYWDYLGGLAGADFYSCDELYLSAKTWLEGGKCYLIRDVEIGHLYRSKHPYRVRWDWYYYNKLLVIRTLLPPDNPYEPALKASGGASTEIATNPYLKAVQMLEERKDLVTMLKDYYATIIKCDLSEMLALNSKYFHPEVAPAAT